MTPVSGIPQIMPQNSITPQFRPPLFVRRSLGHYCWSLSSFWPSSTVERAGAETSKPRTTRCLLPTPFHFQGEDRSKAGSPRFQPGCPSANSSFPLSVLRCLFILLLFFSTFTYHIQFCSFVLDHLGFFTAFENVFSVVGLFHGTWERSFHNHTYHWSPHWTKSNVPITFYLHPCNRVADLKWWILIVDALLLACANLFNLRDVSLDYIGSTANLSAKALRDFVVCRQTPYNRVLSSANCVCLNSEMRLNAVESSSYVTYTATPISQ